MRNLLIFIILSFMTAALKWKDSQEELSSSAVNTQSNIKKYFCKESTQSCEEKIRSGMKNTWENKNRLSLCDTDGDHFTVAIRKLDKSDEGNYKYDCCKNSVTEMTAYLGGNATITCQYPEDHVNRIKYFCKQDDRFICKSKITLKSDKILNKHGRLFVSDNREERAFTVTFTNLTVDDIGVYWCGGKTNVYTTLITEVQLIVNVVNATKRKGGIGDSEGIKERPLQPDSGLATTIYASDSLHYASVNFQKNPVCPTEATAAIAKDDTSFADYATVNFGQSPA
ncbi:unnamed protein product [Coregonus sp. 'balchen']|nr:unnamed protein product [Coregonus sp. 'balchen']